MEQQQTEYIYTQFKWSLYANDTEEIYRKKK